MAMTEEQEKALREELENSKAALLALQAEAAKQKQAEPEVEKDKLTKEKPQKPKVDPDLAKSVSEMSARIEKLEKRLGTEKTGTFKLINFFGGD